jgi:transposase
MKLYIGIDWSERKHDIVILNPAGAILANMVIAHSVDGFREFDQVRRKLGARPEECMLGLETAHNLLIDFLWGQGYSQIYVLPPSSVNRARGQFKVSGAHDDQQDAALIAEMLRVQSQHFRPWHPGGALLQAIRARVNFLQYLTRQRVQLSNRLRSVLLRYYPTSLEVFSGLSAQITLELVLAYPSPSAAFQLSWSEFQSFAKAHHYPQPKRLPACFARLQAPHPQASVSVVQAYQMEAMTLARLLLEVIHAKNDVCRSLQDLYVQHPDYTLFHSLPAAGEILEPALLSKFGEDRRRFPTANSLQVLAGTCPVTKKSGKLKTVSFRRACDREFQQIAQQWAKATLRESVWANAYFMEVLKHSRSASHALRCLANRWLAVAWRVWQDQIPYNETYHLQQHALRAKPK